MAHDFSSILAPQQAKYLSESGSPQQGDEQLKVYWDGIPPIVLNEAKRWLADNRLSVDEFRIEHKVYAGPWHLVSLVAGEDVKVGQIQAIFQKGYATELTWTLARMIAGKKAPGNDSEVTGIANTASADPSRFITIRFPNLSIRKLDIILSSVAETYADPVVNLETLSGNWYAIAATSGRQTDGQKQDDGAGYVDLVLARPQFTMEAFRDWGGIFGGYVTYLWRVPKAIAQDIASAHIAVGPGRSVVAEFSSEAELVNLILYSKRLGNITGSETKLDKSLARFTSSRDCSVVISSDMFWDVEDPNATAFLIGTDPGSGVPYPRAAGTSYSKSVRSNGDGTYDVIIQIEVEQERSLVDLLTSAESGIGTKADEVLVGKDTFRRITRNIEDGYHDDDFLITTAEDGEFFERDLTLGPRCTLRAITDRHIATSFEWQYSYTDIDGLISVYEGRAVDTNIEGDAAPTAPEHFATLAALNSGDLPAWMAARRVEFRTVPSRYAKRWDYTLIAKPGIWTLGGFDAGESHSFNLLIEGKTTCTITVLITSNKTTAANFIDGVNNTYGSLGSHEAGMVYIGKGLWKATKIEAVTP